MASLLLVVFVALLLEASTGGHYAMAYTRWRRRDLDLREFSEPGISNYSKLLLVEEKGSLYVGARDTIYQLSAENISRMRKKAVWSPSDSSIEQCGARGKSQVECFNYISALHVLNNQQLYVCGTHAFKPQCDILDLSNFVLRGESEDGECPHSPWQRFATVMVDEEMYTGMMKGFLANNPVISRSSKSRTSLKTETTWLDSPKFISADLIRSAESPHAIEDDQIYFFFTEVANEYDFFSKLSISRVARVCKGDLGGNHILQKRWTTFIKAHLLCHSATADFYFNVLQDIFIHRGENPNDTVVYGLFNSQWSVCGMSAVCSYRMTDIEKIFASNDYMCLEKECDFRWISYHRPPPMPGACLTNNMRQQDIPSSLSVSDTTLEFAKKHHLMHRAIEPIGGRPLLITRDTQCTHIVVDRVRALDNELYDVIFTGTEKGLLLKVVVVGEEAFTVEEIQLLRTSEPIKTLVLSPKTLWLYATSDSMVVQAPVAVCHLRRTCYKCVTARDPHCAWDPQKIECVNVLKRHKATHSQLIQSMTGNTRLCPTGPRAAP